LQNGQFSAQPLDLRITARQFLPQPLVRVQRRRQRSTQRRVSIRLRDHASTGSHAPQQTPP